MTLPTLIAELEEALKAATPDKWIVVTGSDPLGDTGDSDPWIAIVSVAGNNAVEFVRWYADDEQAEANARLIALMRTHLPALIEAVKRQGEVEHAAFIDGLKAARDTVHSIETSDPYFSSYTRDVIGDILEGNIARAALTAHKETAGG